jgi:hypothetical protein
MVFGTRHPLAENLGELGFDAERIERMPRFQPPQAAL